MTGILLINLGTPDTPTTGAVRKYLKEFLSDPLVIDIPAPARWLLVHGLILPFRSPKSAAAYQKIWGPEGSPLLHYTQELAEKIRAQLGPEPVVEVGMRYGQPSLASACKKLLDRGIKKMIVVPLYPQYADSSTGSSLQEVERITRSWPGAVRLVPPFYDHPGFIESWVEVGQPILDRVRPDHVLFSFHSLPERQIKNHAGCLETPDCCTRPIPEHCYRSQCFATARLTAQGLHLKESNYSISFQSRLGRTPWIKPYTDLLLAELAQQGKKKLVVFCPSFVADCLETLEEIGIRGRETFLNHGGETLELIPSLNVHPTWVKALAKIIDFC